MLSPLLLRRRLQQITRFKNQGNPEVELIFAQIQARPACGRAA
jgi:hypothetical protein